jgi:hypothetical protein
VRRSFVASGNRRPVSLTCPPRPVAPLGDPLPRTGRSSKVNGDVWPMLQYPDGRRSSSAGFGPVGCMCVHRSERYGSPAGHRSAVAGKNGVDQALQRCGRDLPGAAQFGMRPGGREPSPRAARPPQAAVNRPGHPPLLPDRSSGPVSPSAGRTSGGALLIHVTARQGGPFLRAASLQPGETGAVGQNSPTGPAPPRRLVTGAPRRPDTARRAPRRCARSATPRAVVGRPSSSPVLVTAPSVRSAGGRSAAGPAGGAPA